MGGQGHCGAISILVNHRHRSVHTIEVYLMSMLLSIHILKPGNGPYSSSIASWVGNGSSRPKLIISQDDLLRFLLMFGSGIIMASGDALLLLPLDPNIPSIDPWRLVFWDMNSPKSRAEFGLFATSGLLGAFLALLEAGFLCAFVSS